MPGVFERVFGESKTTKKLRELREEIDKLEAANAENARLEAEEAEKARLEAEEAEKARLKAAEKEKTRLADEEASRAYQQQLRAKLQAEYERKNPKPGWVYSGRGS